MSRPVWPTSRIAELDRRIPRQRGALGLDAGTVVGVTAARGLQRTAPGTAVGADPRGQGDRTGDRR